SALLVGLLTLWWFLLVDPMLYLLQAGAGIFLQIEKSASGDWTVQVPLETILPATPQQPVARQLRSLQFDMASSDAVTFTFSLPVYWAIILAAPGGLKRKLRPLLLGSAVMALVELALLLAFAYITALDGASQMAGADDAAGKWLRHLGVYLVASVLPYVGPFVVALSFHRELRQQVFAVGSGVGRRVKGY
ncbi:MAG: hypothetical protein M3O20_17925, partial [Acidobacteriota bacterium]|nr:hypothetical protein [Acidobacteriota bacterium]